MIMIDETDRNSADDIELNSVWQLGQRLAVVAALIDDKWITIEYIDGNNGMKRTVDIDIPQFLSFYRLFYRPKNKYYLLQEILKNTPPISLD
tara:strand:+ start:115 stop:390 length:276 start_codon:yes stop_codon:yes gene_type:complete